MSLRFYRSFSTEIQKLAADLGGTKTAARFNEMAIGAHDLSTKNKVDNTYQDVRDYGAAAGKGAFTAAAALGLKDKMRGTAASPRAYKGAVLLGAGLMAADRKYRHGKIHNDEKPLAKLAFTDANPNRAFGSPAMALASGQRTGGLSSKTVRSSLAKPPKVVSLGRRFRFPA